MSFDIYGDKTIEKLILDKLEDLHLNNPFGKYIKYILESSNMQVFIYDENQIKDLKEKHNPKGSLTLARAFFHNSENKIVLYNTRYETRESILWIFLHEIGHLIYKDTYGTEILDQEFLLNKNIINDNELYFKQDSFIDIYLNDEIHENLPSEIIANTIANYFIKKDYSRKWWRKNIKKVDRKEEERWKKILNK